MPGRTFRASARWACEAAVAAGAARESRHDRVGAGQAGIAESDEIFVFASALGRRELRPFSDWSDGRPETELSFKLHRQVTNKVAGIPNETAEFLRGFF